MNQIESGDHSNANNSAVKRSAESITPFTDFYDKYIYAILISIGLLNAVIAVIIVLYPGKTAWTPLLGSTIFLLGIPLAIYSFVEEKARIGFKKNLIALCVTLLISVLQPITGVFKDSNFESLSIVSAADEK